MDPVNAATQAIQGLSPSQAAPAPAVNVSMPAGLNALGQTAAQAGSGGQSPFASEINKLFATQQAAVPTQLQAFSNQSNAATQASNNYYNWQAQHQKSIADLQNQAQQANPANYKRLPGQDGGYNFTDPSGQKITAGQYAAATNSDVTSVLSGSSNPVDQQYISDHKQLESMLQAYQGGSQQDLDNAAKKAGFKNADDMHTSLGKLGINGPDDLQNAFVKSYPNVWGGGQGTSVGNQRPQPQAGVQGPATFYQPQGQNVKQGGGGQAVLDYITSLGGLLGR